jgi:hypothetical protein
MFETIFAVFITCSDGSICEEGSKLDTMAQCRAAVAEFYALDRQAHCREVPWDGQPRDVGSEIIDSD